jgi:hypothetical protein
MRAVKKLKLVHVKLIRGLHHEGIAAADQLSADARDVSKLPRGALARAYLDRAGGAYDWGAAQYGGRDKLVTAEIKRCLRRTVWSIFFRRSLFCRAFANKLTPWAASRASFVRGCIIKERPGVRGQTHVDYD